MLVSFRPPRARCRREGGTPDIFSHIIGPTSPVAMFADDLLTKQKTIQIEIRYTYSLRLHLNTILLKSYHEGC